MVALPREAPKTGELAWLSYRGHWGQRERFFDDGPTGPAAKDRWRDPVEWVEENGRETSVALPFARSGATKTFCSLSATGSALFNRILAEPIQVAVLSVVGLVALVVFVRFGSRGLLGRAARTWWRNRRAFVAIGAVTFAGGVLAWLAQYAVLEVTRLDALVEVVGSSSPWVLPLVALAAAVVLLPVFAWVIAATMLLEHGEPDATRALGVAARSRSAVLRSGVVVIATVGLTLFVLPFFVVLMSLWLLAPAASSREHLLARPALRRSRRLLQGHRWRSLALSITLCLVLAIGGLIGALVLLTPFGFTGAAIALSAANAFLIPYAALVAVHYYEDVSARREVRADQDPSRGSA